jgi:hypothetical protein
MQDTLIEQALPTEALYEQPRYPNEILGFNIAALQRVGDIAIGAGLLKQNLQPKIDALPQAASLVDLALEIKAGARLTYEDLHEHAEPLGEIAGRRARVAMRFAANEHLRDWVMEKINDQIPKQANKQLDKVRGSMERINDLESKVDIVSAFDNPQEEFSLEMHELAQNVYRTVLDERDRRVQSGVITDGRPEAPGGLKGLAVKVYRKVRDFFSFFKRGRRSKSNHEVTAYDVGTAVESVYAGMISGHATNKPKTPMLYGLVADRLPRYKGLITKNNMAIVAPEMLRLFASVSPDLGDWQDLIKSVEYHPHEFRFMTRIIKHYKGHSLAGIQRAASSLLPAIQNALPSDSTLIRQAFMQMQQLLRPMLPNTEQEDELVDAPRESLLRGVKNVAKNRVKKILMRVRAQ